MHVSVSCLHSFDISYITAMAMECVQSFRHKAARSLRHIKPHTVCDSVSSVDDDVRTAGGPCVTLISRYHGEVVGDHCDNTSWL